ncbi:MAG: hypothetical protein ACLPWS_07905 [Rhodomicrobium sp.]
MTSVLTPVLPENTPLTLPHGTEMTESQALHKQDTREYLADMLRELSAIAAWADLNRAQEYIDAALHELEAEEDQR